VNLGLIAAGRGDHDEVRDIYSRLSAQVPQLVRDVERDMRAGAGADQPLSDPMAAMFEHALRVMRGNRSSNRVTYFLGDGAARVLGARALSPV
jgi:hypothetical protein